MNDPVAHDACPAPAPAAEALPERYHALDHLRAVAMLLGIYLHAAIPYMHTPVPWALHDPKPSFLFDVSVGLIHGFRMQLFFFIAGFFACLVHRRLGNGPYFRRRLLRIGVPFVLGMATLLPLIFIVWQWSATVSGTTENMGEFASDPKRLADLPTAHLWFLEYLLFYYAAVFGLHLFGSRKTTDAPKQPHRGDRLFARVMGSRAKPFLLALATFGFLMGGPQLGEPEMAGVSVVPRPAAAAYYGMYFLFGWWLCRQRGLLARFTDFPGCNVALAFLSFLVYGGCLEVAEKAAEVPTAVYWVGNFAAEVFTWTAIFVFTAIFLKWCDRSRPWSRYAAEASYWFYLAHLPLVVALQAAFHPWNVHVLVKCALVNVVSLVLLLASYHLFVRYTPVGTLLNGRRTR